MKSLLLVMVSLLLFAACNRKEASTTNNPTNKPITNQAIMDKHSFAKPHEAVIKHLVLDINVDFKTKIITGKATYLINNITKTNKLFLDTKDLKIAKVELRGYPTTFKIGEEKPFIGRPLEIEIYPTTDSVTVYYETSPQAEALQWLSAQQTSSKKQPFLFTQSQAILARSWVPCQDSPGIRFTYQATVTVPENLLAVMSANNPTEKNNKGIYKFVMDKPIPAYLLALAVGDFSFKSLGDRTGVYAESNMLEKAVKEFEGVESMLVAAEKLYGNYDWGRYDILVMPASFPFGGMENPKLTFATPTIITGDKSLVNLVAHELAHSWSGNLVTNATWEDFWLNEGFTVFFERRIMESVAGKQYSDMLELIGYQDLEDEIQLLESGYDTKLKLNLTNRNPDDGVTSIAYEKGFFLLRTIENAVGRENFDIFIKQYFQHFAYKAVTTEEFIDYVKANLFNKFPTAKQQVNLEQWIYEVGLPKNCPQIQSINFEYVDKCVAAYINGSSPTLFKTATWSSFEWLRFIRNLPEDLNTTQMQELDKVFKLSNTTNAEIAAAWFTLAATKNYENAYLPMEKFLTQVGRRKFVMPIYTALYKNKDIKAQNWATQTYKKARPYYHFVTTNSLDKLLGYTNL
jgi:leukotriene-A4 hydrolase